tara:strand:- start:40 stop:273 length:234 start_codon:yes stop_codon:yes gene_type:complete
MMQENQVLLDKVARHKDHQKEHLENIKEFNRLLVRQTDQVKVLMFLSLPKITKKTGIEHIRKSINLIFFAKIREIKS